MIDATQGVTEQDTKIAGIAHEEGKAIIILVNKWDAVEKETKTLENYKKNIETKLAYMPYAPILFISVKTGQRLNKISDLIEFVHNQASMRITTGMLNDVINEAIAIVPPPTHKGKRLKVFYMTQISIKPPTFVVFINNKDLFHFSYERYLENQIRKKFGFEGSRLQIIARERGDKK